MSKAADPVAEMRERVQQMMSEKFQCFDVHCSGCEHDVGVVAEFVEAELLRRLGASVDVPACIHYLLGLSDAEWEILGQNITPELREKIRKHIAQPAGAVCRCANQDDSDGAYCPICGKCKREPMAQPGAEGRQKDLELAAELLEEMYDKWENGDPATTEDGDSLGNAFQLGDRENVIIDVLNRLFPPKGSPSKPAAPAEQPEPEDRISPPMNEASVRVINSIVQARVPESAFLRDEEPAAEQGAEQFWPTWWKENFPGTITFLPRPNAVKFAEAYAAHVTKGMEARLAKAERMVRVAENAFKLQDAVDIPGKTGEMNCLQIAKAWRELERQKEAAEARNLELIGADVQRVKDISRLTADLGRTELQRDAALAREVDLKERLAEAEKALRAIERQVCLVPFSQLTALEEEIRRMARAALPPSEEGK